MPIQEKPCLGLRLELALGHARSKLLPIVSGIPNRNDVDALSLASILSAFRRGFVTDAVDGLNDGAHNDQTRNRRRAVFLHVRVRDWRRARCRTFSYLERVRRSGPVLARRNSKIGSGAQMRADFLRFSAAAGASA